MFLELSWLIPTILFASLPIIIFLEYKKEYAGAILSIISSTISAILSIGGFIEIVGGASTKTTLFTWLSYGSISITFGIYADKLSMFMCVVVSTIGTLILIYSLEYMSHDRERSKLAWPRYYSEVTLFIAFMLLLVLSYNLIQLLIAWEGVGLCSYLLIGYWWWKPEASSAAKKAFITTRFGDMFLYAAIVYAFWAFGTLDIPKINQINPTLGMSVSLAIFSFLLFGAAIGKSAQIPLFTWLPWAMEGPSTVSALIHAATMVKAGVYLVARFYPAYANAAAIFGVPPLRFVAYIGGITAAFAGLVAIVNNDVKGVLAYSTISHLGLLMLALGIRAYPAALFHLINHAFFKAGLFLVSGNILHATGEIRNLHGLGGLKSNMKITYILAFLGAYSISGFFPAGCFWSKDAILLGILYGGDKILLLLGVIAAISGPAYIFRWFSLIFHGKHKNENAAKAGEVSWIMLIPTAILMLGSILWGIPLLYHGHLAPIGEIIVNSATISTLGTLSIFGGAEYIMELGILGGGIIIAVVMYYIYAVKQIDFSKYRMLMHIQRYFQQGTIIDKAYDKATYKLFGEYISRSLAYFDTKILDKAYIKTGNCVLRVGKYFRRIQTGHVGDYVAIYLAGLIFILIILTIAITQPYLLPAII